MKITQSSFASGMHSGYTPFKVPESGYRLGFNCRVRSNVVEGAFKPIRIPAPVGNFQALFPLDDKLILVSNGTPYQVKPDTNDFTALSVPILDPSETLVYHQTVPAPTAFFQKDASGNLVFNERISSQPECVVLQDGKSQPPIITPQLGVRRTNTYAQWSYNNPEYVPVGRQMTYNGSALYVAAVDGRSIYRSVSGRPLDFVQAISDGEKQGDATSTSFSVATSVLSALWPSQAGGILGATYYKMYGAVPDFSAPTQFDEPYMSPTELFPVGCVSQYATVTANGETLFVSPQGIMTFNQTMQAKRESNNTPFGAAITDFLVRPITYAACETANDYVFFGLSTIFGDGIVVYDLRLNTFVSIDIVGRVKEFAILRSSGVDRLFFITFGNELYEMPLYEGERSSPTVFFGFANQQDPTSIIRPDALSLLYADVKTSGHVTVRVIQNDGLTEEDIQTLTRATPAGLDSIIPQLPDTFRAQQVTPVVSSFTDKPYSYAVSIGVTCSADAKLVALTLEAAVNTVDRPVTKSDETEHLEVLTYRAVGFVTPESIQTRPIAATVGQLYYLYGMEDPSYVLNAGTRIQTRLNTAKRFVAGASSLNTSPFATVYDFLTFETLLGTEKTNGLFLLGDLGGEPFAAVFEAARRNRETIHAILGPTDQDTEEENADYISQSKRPVRYVVSTPFIDFYCFSFPLRTVDMARDANGNLIGVTPEEMTEDGTFCRWMRRQIENRDSGKFIVAMFGFPPYSGCSTFAPGFAALRWAFHKYGVHAVVCNGRAYERYTYNNVLYLNVGTGSRNALLESPGDNGLAVPGMLEITASPNVLTFDFLDENRISRDTSILTL